MKIIIVIITFLNVFTMAYTSGQNTGIYQFSDSIQKQYKDCYLGFNKDICDYAVWELTSIGAYSSVLSTWNINNSNKLNYSTLKPIDKSEYKIMPAKKIILDSAQHKKVIMLNEAHHVTPHRLLTLELLSDLRKTGFTHLGIEGLSESDLLLVKRGYPIHRSGYYLKEPHFANMVRVALKLGYKVFGYDTYTDDNSVKLREYTQALNIANIIQQDTNARVIIHAGWGHIREDTAIEGGLMAYQFKKMTGIDPFTINQTRMNEQSSASFENEIYKQFNEIKAPVVLLNKKTQHLYTDSLTDCILFHPRTYYKSNRPSWLHQCKTYISKEIPLEPQLTFPLLILVYDMQECEKSKAAVPVEIAVPVDIQELRHPSKTARLFFPYHGSFKIIFKEANKNKNIQIILKI
jgi:hypothetical protein